MKVILTSDVKGKGKAGDVITVADSYGKNCVINKGLGVEATAENLNNLKLKKKNEDKIEAERVAKAKETKKKLDGQVVKISITLGENGKPFGSITNGDIAKEVKSQLGIDIDKKAIKMVNGTIDVMGDTVITVKLHKDVQAKFTLRSITSV